MKQEFNGAVEQVAAGDILNNLCLNSAACACEQGEAERQRRFEKHTGIACSGGARDALQHLLDTGAFDYKQLAIAWRTRSLWWDWNELRLNANASRWEYGYGLFVMILAVVMCTIGFLFLIYMKNRSTWLDLMQIAILLLMFCSVVPIAEKYMLRPNRIAKRAASFLEEYYVACAMSKEK